MTDSNPGLVRWILLSTVGFAAGVPAGLVLGAPLEGLVGAVLLTPIMLALSGTFLGAAQWFGMPRGEVTAARWIGATAVGLSAGFTTALVIVENGGAWLAGAPVRMATVSTPGLVASVVVLGLVGGTVLGIVQARALPHRSAARAWIVASTLAMTSGFLVAIVCGVAVGGLGTAVGVGALLVVTGVVYSTLLARVVVRTVS